jgi:hypothetical protein
VFKSRTNRTDDKLIWSFDWLNHETRGLGYVAEQHSHASQALIWDKAVLKFAFMFPRGNLIRSKESKRAIVDMYLRQLRLSAGS